MNKERMKYMEKGNIDAKVIRTEILFTPLLVIFPIIIGLAFIHEWYNQGFLLGDPSYNGELILGIIIIVGNIMFDIPFIKSLRQLTRDKKLKK